MVVFDVIFIQMFYQPKEYVMIAVECGLAEQQAVGYSKSTNKSTNNTAKRKPTINPQYLYMYM